MSDQPTTPDPADPTASGTPPQPPHTTAAPGMPAGGTWNQPYGAAPMWGAQRPEAPNAILILIFGILGIVVMPILAPVAWYMGSKSRSEMQGQPPGTFENEGAVTAGWICGIIGTILLAIYVLVVIGMIIVLIAAASTSDLSIIGA